MRTKPRPSRCFSAKLLRPTRRAAQKIGVKSAGATAAAPAPAAIGMYVGAGTLVAAAVAVATAAVGRV